MDTEAKCHIIRYRSLFHDISLRDPCTDQIEKKDLDTQITKTIQSKRILPFYYKNYIRIIYDINLKPMSEWNLLVFKNRDQMTRDPTT
jgi:hypothetical protein